MGASVLIAGQPSSPPHLGCAYPIPFGTYREPFLERTGIQQKKIPQNIENHGGAEGNRTPDLLNAIQALSQLSYSPGKVLVSGTSDS